MVCDYDAEARLKFKLPPCPNHEDYTSLNEYREKFWVYERARGRVLMKRQDWVTKEGLANERRRREEEWEVEAEREQEAKRQREEQAWEDKARCPPEMGSGSSPRPLECLHCMGKGE